jgi:hypothetical protein
MKKIILLMVITTAIFKVNAQPRTFKSDNPNSGLCKFIITVNSTVIHEKIGGQCSLSQTFSSAPQQSEDNYSHTEYKGVFVKTDKIAKRTYEIMYRIYSPAGENKGAINFGTIKQTIDYKDSRPTKVIEQRFSETN